MKNLKVGLIILLISFVLIGNIGLPVFKHFCNSSGEVSATILVENDHCEDEHVSTCCEVEKKKKDCCDEETSYIKLHFDYFHSLENQSFAFVIPNFSELTFNFSKENVNEDQKNYFVFTDPDPPSGREILIKNQVFRI